MGRQRIIHEQGNYLSIRKFDILKTEMFSWRPRWAKTLISAWIRSNKPVKNRSFSEVSQLFVYFVFRVEPRCPLDQTEIDKDDVSRSKKVSLIYWDKRLKRERKGEISISCAAFMIFRFQNSFDLSHSVTLFIIIKLNTPATFRRRNWVAWKKPGNLA